MDMNATLKSFDLRSCIDSLESPSDEVNEDEGKKEQANNERAMNISNWANIFLQIYATIQSGSLAIILQHQLWILCMI
nr:metal tolerance protein 4 [Ipomoea batatas]